MGQEPLRVCHLAKYYPPATGGIETHLHTLAQAQTQLGAQVHVLCVNHQDTRRRDVTFQTLASTPTVEESDGSVQVIRVGRRASLFRFDVCPDLLGLSSILARRRVDVVHLHVPNPTMLLALAGIPDRYPLIISYHSDVVRQKTLGRALRPFEDLVFRRASTIVAGSPPYHQSSPVLQRYTERVRVIPYGLDLQPFLQPTPAALAHAQQLRQQHGEVLWLCVGRLVYYKGLSIALEALQHVPGKLLLIGQGPLAGELEALSRSLGIADRVIFLGRTSDEELAGAYQAATALWFPSNARSEAFGLVQVEAMASGCPVINTALTGSGVPWVSRHEESGLTVPVGNPQALAEAARRLLDEVGLRERLVTGGRTRATQEFEVTTMARRSLEAYHSTLDRRLSRRRSNGRALRSGDEVALLPSTST